MGGEANPNMAASRAYPPLASRPVGKQINRIYQDRLKQFVDGGQYREQGLIGYAPSAFQRQAASGT